jgi:hypothetical protein
MKRGLMIAALLALAGCGSTVTTTSTVRRPPSLGPARGEGADRQPVVRRFKPEQGAVVNPTFHVATGCGMERWAVKTGTDPGASMVSLTPQGSTIADLTAIRPPAGPTDRVAPTETTTFQLSATILAIKQEADSDYHLEIADANGNTMIAEAPSPSCDSGSVFTAQIGQARQAINAACPNVTGTYQHVSIPADLTGVGFFDRIHGQLGVAPNGIELHPVLAIKLSGHC